MQKTVSLEMTKRSCTSHDEIPNVIKYTDTPKTAVDDKLRLLSRIANYFIFMALMLVLTSRTLI